MNRELVVCVNRRLTASTPSCAGRGSEALIEALEAEAKRRGIILNIQRIFCFGLCERGPNVRIKPGGRFFHRVSNADIGRILDQVAAE